MTIILDLTPELEQSVRAAAANAGLPPDMYIAEALRQRLPMAVDTERPHHVSKREAELLRAINHSLSTHEWEEYHSLIAKRQAAILTSDEHAALLTMSDALERANVARVAAVVALAQLRNTSFAELWHQLQI